MAEPIKFLCIHGLGNESSYDWEGEWRSALERAFSSMGVKPETQSVQYDPIFANVDISVEEAFDAAWKLIAAGAGLKVRSRAPRGGIGDVIRFTAGYVVAWLSDEGFQRQTRAEVLRRIVEVQPDVIAAHSLGSLLVYEAIQHPDASAPDVRRAIRNARLVTFGSQLKNKFVEKNLPYGRVEPLPVKFWHHLYNKHDDVFTAPINLPGADNFEQTQTEFGGWMSLDHSPSDYFLHEAAIANVWRPIVAERVRFRGFGAAGRPRRRTPEPYAAKPVGPARKRALLIGINEYPRAEDRLEGCVNDVYLMSSALQDCGFQARDIRVCLDRRATQRGILERLDWLFDGAGPGDDLVFYYSGHGAQMPEYGAQAEPDRKVETLVPWDFDWSLDTAVTDDHLSGLYANLPYEVRFAMILDCCHSGGMHRSGGARVKGISPPDDIRHREIEWDRDTRTWVPRGFKIASRSFVAAKDKKNEDEILESYFGEGLDTLRLGRSAPLRHGFDDKRYEAMKKRRGGPVGPYLPMIVEACAEREFSYEYVDGVVSYGAFTFNAVKIMRENLVKRTPITFGEIEAEVSRQLRDSGYRQTPKILGPKTYRSAPVPWLLPETGKRSANPRRQK
jgi:hypothetical protein